MMRALTKQLFRGGLSAAVASLTALCIAAGLYVAVTHFQPVKKAFAEAAPTPGCMPSHCRPKPASAR